MIYIDPLTFVYCALIVLTIPLSWLLPCLLAACIHELGHILMILICHGNIQGIRIHVGGAVIYANVLQGFDRLLCSLAGPLSSLLLVLLFGIWPRLAVCGLVQGIFNLLPLNHLDGGRILSCVAELWFPNKPRLFFRILQGVTAAAAGFALQRLFFS